MKKDILLAIGAGLLIGAIGAIGVVNLPTLLKKGTGSQTATEQTENVSPTAPPITKTPTASILTIESPRDGAVAAETEITVKGKTRVKDIVVIDTDTESYSQQTGDDGTFAIDVSIGEGGNHLTVTSYNESGESETKDMTVVYTKEKL